MRKYRKSFAGIPKRKYVERLLIPTNIKERKYQWVKNNIEKVKESRKRYRQTIANKYYVYKNQAKLRLFEWELTEEDFLEFWKKPCVYCGSEILTIGLDRKDSLVGYTKENIVSCCTICNRMKGTMSIEEFLKHCEAIMNHSL